MPLDVSRTSLPNASAFVYEEVKCELTKLAQIIARIVCVYMHISQILKNSLQIYQTNGVCVYVCG